MATSAASDSDKPLNCLLRDSRRCVVVDYLCLLFDKLLSLQLKYEIGLHNIYWPTVSKLS